MSGALGWLKIEIVAQKQTFTGPLIVGHCYVRSSWQTLDELSSLELKMSGEWDSFVTRIESTYPRSRLQFVRCQYLFETLVSMALGGPSPTSAAVKSKFLEIICQLLAVVGLLFNLLFTLISLANTGLLPRISEPPPHRLLRS